MYVHTPGLMRALFFFLLLISIPLFGETFGNIEDVRLVRVYDGDTVFVDIEGMHPLIGEEIGIRVRGVDTPEIRGNCDEEKGLAQMAKRFAESMLLDAERIDLVDVERGKYFRIVATVLVDGVSLGNLLIDAGLAVHYDGKKKTHDWCD